MKRAVITLRLSPELHHLLIVAAATNGQSVNEWATHHLEVIARDEVDLYVKQWQQEPKS